MIKKYVFSQLFASLSVKNKCINKTKNLVRQWMWLEWRRMCFAWLKGQWWTRASDSVPDKCLLAKSAAWHLPEAEGAAEAVIGSVLIVETSRTTQRFTF